jgi:hypothetical protein
VLPQLFVRLSVVKQGRDLGNKSIADRKDTRYPGDGSDHVRSKAVHAEKYSAGNQDDPYSQRDRAASARSPILLAGGRLHGGQDIPTTSAGPSGPRLGRVGRVDDIFIHRSEVRL